MKTAFTQRAILVGKAADYASDRRGNTSIEYAIIAIFVAVVLILMLGNIGQNTQKPFNDVAGAFDDGSGPGKGKNQGKGPGKGKGPGNHKGKGH